jgi:hypothetical protein
MQNTEVFINALYIYKNINCILPVAINGIYSLSSIENATGRQLYDIVECILHNCKYVMWVFSPVKWKRMKLPKYNNVMFLKKYITEVSTFSGQPEIVIIKFNTSNVPVDIALLTDNNSKISIPNILV